MRKQLVLASFAAMLAPAYGQLHLITGSPTPKYNQTFASTLFQVDDGGSVKSVAELVPSDIGTSWITISYDLRKVILFSDSVIAVDFDKAAIVKSCTQPHPPSGMRSMVDHWLMDTPSRGAIVAEEYFDGSGAAFWGMIMDPSVPCNKSFLPIDASELSFIVSNGYSGVADVGSLDRIQVFPDVNGRIKCRWPVGGSETDFGYTLPMDMLSGISQPYYAVITILNHELLALSVTDRTPEKKQKLFVLRKSDKTWHRVSVPTEQIYWQRVFGNFIAIAEARTKSPQAFESAGRAEWRKTDSKMGPSVSNRLRDANVVFPGRLYLYNVDTQHVYAVTTNQGDSEVLLVENNVVYYRASDRLYSVSITETGLGPSKLLATDEAIRDAHWAFMKH